MRNKNSLKFGSDNPNRCNQKVVSAMESLYQGMDPKEALDQAAEETNRALEVANKKQGN
jgi:hypothetical protein